MAWLDVRISHSMEQRVLHTYTLHAGTKVYKVVPSGGGGDDAGGGGGGGGSNIDNNKSSRLLGLEKDNDIRSIHHTTSDSV